MKAATVYARFGWSVVPLHSALEGVCSCPKGSACPSAGKHPRISEWESKASNDPATVAEWVARWPRANLGIATGQPSGFFVLDVDRPESLEALVAEHGELPETARQRTGSGGSHFLFQLPGWQVRNSASKLAPGVDVRGDGGQIVVAPSVSAKGAYTWIAPPWTTPIAPAPEWLLELMRRPSLTRAASTSPAAPSERPAFPPASRAVLDQALAALELHGPAIEGDGGDEHTFRAAAILAHDYALTFDEAWPLFVDWNAGCSPPWPLEDLAAKLRGGDRYGTKPYGCARELDARTAVKLQIDAWRAAPDPDGNLPALVARCRPLAGLVTDRTLHTLIARDLAEATGLSAKQLDLPAPARPKVEPPPDSITVTPKLHEAADLATRAILPHVFARNGVLCEVVRAERTFLADLEPARILDLMSHTKWVRHDDQGIVTTPPPPAVAQILHARRTHAGVRVIESVTTAPIFLANGEILQARGYNPEARVFLEPSVFVDVPDDPTLEDSRNAIRVFRDLVGDFHFHAREDFSAWLAGVLSPLVKSAIVNAPVPLVCVSASSPGAGKTMLTELAAAIVTGAKPEVRPYNPRDPSEWGKRLTSYVRAASPISVFDNVNGPFGDEGLDRLITSSTWSDRVLGASDAPPIPVVSCWWATGNNIEPQGDTVRRVLMVRIEVDTERPQERSDFKRPLLVDYALEHRSELLTAALTILRAYHVAGRPDVQLPPWGSFGAWSALVRGALVWAGAADPFLTQRRAAAELNEADNEAHDFWLSVVEDSDGAPNSIALAANARSATEILGLREQVTAFSLRKLIRRFVDKPRAGRRIRRDGARYFVELVAPRAA